MPASRWHPALPRTASQTRAAKELTLFNQFPAGWLHHLVRKNSGRAHPCPQPLPHRRLTLPARAEPRASACTWPGSGLKGDVPVAAWPYGAAMGQGTARLPTPLGGRRGCQPSLLVSRSCLSSRVTELPGGCFAQWYLITFLLLPNIKQWVSDEASSDVSLLRLSYLKSRKDGALRVCKARKVGCL